MAWEYRDALDHLLVLKKEWLRKQNVLRYLAATYYRLGQYDDAVRELNEAIEVWPAEVCLKEQLARVLESAGRVSEAARIWERISKDNPKHPVAERNMNRLDSTPPELIGRETPAPEMEPGSNLRPGLMCPSCGAQNGEEFERCWQCHAPLSQLRRRDEPSRAPRRPIVEPWVWTLLGGLAIVACLSIGVYFTLQQWSSQSLSFEQIPKSVTAFDLLSRNLVLTRTILGAALLLAWPIGLRLGARLLKADHVSGATHNVVGALLASLTYALTWAPPRCIAYVPLTSGVVSLLIVALVYRPGWLRAPALWIAQSAIVIGIELVALGVAEGPYAILDIVTVSRFFADGKLLQGPGAHTVRGAHLPCDLAIDWKPTGSTWLDQKVGPVAFEITPIPASPPLTVNLQEAERSVYYRDLEGTPYRFARTISPGTPYHLIVGWRDLDLKQTPMEGAIVIYSVLPPRVSAQTNPT